MLIRIITAWISIGVLCTAFGSKGTFWVNELNELGWPSYILAMIATFVCAPCWVVCGFIEGIEEMINEQKS